MLIKVCPVCSGVCPRCPSEEARNERHLLFMALTWSIFAVITGTLLARTLPNGPICMAEVLVAQVRLRQYEHVLEYAIEVREDVLPYKMRLVSHHGLHAECLIIDLGPRNQ
jgi:hypothetical protein